MMSEWHYRIDAVPEVGRMIEISYGNPDHLIRAKVVAAAPGAYYKGICDDVRFEVVNTGKQEIPSMVCSKWRYVV